MNFKTSKSYWNNVYSSSPKIVAAVNEREYTLSNHVNLAFCSFFRKILKPYIGRNAKLLEIGCGSSQWLPYFQKEMGFDVSGIDYSPEGCQKSEKILADNNATGKIYCEDFHSPPFKLVQAFDIVVSFGVVEHFEKTAKCLQNFAFFLKPGGIMITIVPNLGGLPGFIQQRIDRVTFDKHIVMSPSDFEKSAKDTYLQNINSDYFLTSNFYILNLNSVAKKGFSWLLKKIFLIFLTRCSKIIWYLEKKFKTSIASSLLSPYIISIIRKRG